MPSYQCEHCSGTYEEIPEREPEAQAEAKKLFSIDGDLVRICHSCWVLVMMNAERQGVIGPQWRELLDEEDRKLIGRLFLEAQ
jgi:putative intracellular protease/amidase